jgi:hypothetical protein
MIATVVPRTPVLVHHCPEFQDVQARSFGPSGLSAQARLNARPDQVVAWGDAMKPMRVVRGGSGGQTSSHNQRRRKCSAWNMLQNPGKSPSLRKTLGEQRASSHPRFALSG